MKLAIFTLGCKVNQAESAALERGALSAGHTLCEPSDADAIVVNTCAVTAEAARKCRQAIRRLVALGKPVYAAGCYAKLERDAVTELGAQLLEGSELAQLRSSAFAGGKPLKRSRALLKIQDGCDNFCAYCVIPYARGRSVSLPVEPLLTEVERFSADGVLETMITGIEIASYGRDLAEPLDLAGLVTLIAARVPAMRLQLGSLEPRVVTREFCESIAGKVVPKFHLSLQSGCDTVLKRMNRRYDTFQFARSLALLREHFPGAFVSADVIVGFPGETDAEFAQTLEFVRACAFDHAHVFPYSARPGTRAAAMPGQLEPSVMQARAAAIRALEVG